MQILYLKYLTFFLFHKKALEDLLSIAWVAFFSKHLFRKPLPLQMQLRIEEITEKGEQKLEKLWKEYQQALAEYVQHTEGFYADYMDLKEKDEEYTNQTREYCYEIEKASNQLAALKLTVADAEDKSEVKLKHLKDLKEYMMKKHAELKERIDAELQGNQEKFKTMSVESYQAVKVSKMAEFFFIFS